MKIACHSGREILTKTAFERAYAARSSMTVDQLRSRGRVVRPCDCGSEDCEGWQNMSQESAYNYDLGFNPTIWKRAWVWLLTAWARC